MSDRGRRKRENELRRERSLCSTLETVTRSDVMTERHSKAGETEAKREREGETTEEREKWIEIAVGI